MIHAAEINQPNVRWLNTEKPKGLGDLNGRVLVLDFWTFCCVNCLHVIPVLNNLEQIFGDRILVVGVHSPKFTNERDINQVADAIKRYDIRHPVIHDADCLLWDQYAIKAWPTLVVVSPDGYVIGTYPGEPQLDVFEALIAQALAGESSALTSSPVAQEWKPDSSVTTFRYPAKIKPAFGISASWALADTGHHQVVFLTRDGTENRRFGSGKPGLLDGARQTARFDGPEGLCCTESSIYVTDTRNHAIRCIDIETGHVTTLAGTGQRGVPLSSYWSDGLHTDLASPWDVEIAGDTLYFANAGTHQIGELRLMSGQVRLAAGSGREGIHDGPAAHAHLAQPSGLAYDVDEQKLYFVDSETSAVRSLDLRNKNVESIVGQGLFVFGDVDGSLDDTRLQHPLGLALCADKIYVADTYNNAVKVINLKEKIASKLDAGNYVCEDSLCISISEPAGVSCSSDDRLLVVDTNNHRIVEYDLSNQTRVTWSPVAENGVRKKNVGQC